MIYWPHLKLLLTQTHFYWDIKARKIVLKQKNPSHFWKEFLYI